MPTFDARLVFGAGTADEPVAVRGVALLAANTLTWDLHDLSDLYAFTRAGGLHNVDVASDRTTFSAYGIDNNIDRVLAGLRRWVVDGVYDDSAASFITSMRREIKRNDDQALLTDAWRTSLFGPNHPYVAAGIVRRANSALTLQDAERFRRAYYTPDNATLIIAGHFDADAADEWIDFLFSKWSDRAAGRARVPVAAQPAAIAKLDDTVLVQLRIAIAATGTRAQQLVAAEMLSEIARDVRFKLGASYTFDAQLAETRLANFLVFAGWIDAARAADAVELVRDRIIELRRDATVAARSFVVARDHVLTTLRSRVGSASALAARVEHDVELGRPPLSDLDATQAVQSLTIADMTETLHGVDLAQATVLMDGPKAEIARAFEVLGRTPRYVEAPAITSTSTSGPGETIPAFVGEPQEVYRSSRVPALTEQPPARRLLQLSASAALASVTNESAVVSGTTVAAAVGYRYAWYNAIGAYVDIGRLSDTSSSNGLPRTVTITPLDVLVLWHLGSGQRTWGELLGGVHFQHSSADSQWRAGALYGVQAGLDVIRHRDHRIGLLLRWESTTHSETDYQALSLGLVYRQ